MFRTGNSGWLAIALVAATCLLTATVGWAQQPYDTFQVNYFSNANTVRGPMRGQGSLTRVLMRLPTHPAISAR